MHATRKRVPKPRPTPKALPVGDHRHGTLNGYTNHACRCEDCTAANTEYVAKWRDRRRGAA